MSSRIQALRQRAFQRQGGRCCYCQVAMWLHDQSELPFAVPSAKAALRLQCTAEHLTARADGGRNSSTNVAAACLHCNRTRHRRRRISSPDEFKRVVLARVASKRWHPTWVLNAGSG